MIKTKKDWMIYYACLISALFMVKETLESEQVFNISELWKKDLENKFIKGDVLLAINEAIEAIQREQLNLKKTPESLVGGSSQIH